MKQSILGLAAAAFLLASVTVCRAAEIAAGRSAAERIEIQGEMLNDVRVALRWLFKSPGFTCIAVAAVALAIGANSAVFSSVNALLVRPLPYHEPSRLVFLWGQFSKQGLDRIPVSPAGYVDSPPNDKIDIL
jgi:hypothetical protein